MKAAESPAVWGGGPIETFVHPNTNLLASGSIPEVLEEIVGVLRTVRDGQEEMNRKTEGAEGKLERLLERVEKLEKAVRRLNSGSSRGRGKAGGLADDDPQRKRKMELFRSIVRENLELRGKAA